MANPTPSDVHVNEPLTNIAVAYMQAAERFVAARVFPIVPVEKQSDRYFVYDRGDWLSDQAQLRAPATESAGGGWRVDNTPTYYCNVFAIHKDVDDQTRANSKEPINMDRDATQWVTQQLLIKRERLFAETAMDTGVWGTDLVGGADITVWSDTTDGTPIADIDDARDLITSATGFIPNTLVLSPKAFSLAKNHPTVLERVKYTQKAVITADILAGLFEVDNVFVLRAVVNSAAEGADADVDFIVTDACALLCYVEPQPSILKPSAGYTFAWEGLLGSREGLRIKSFRMENLAADRIEGESAIDIKVVAPECGVFLSGLSA